jgi:hypothetical protein
MPLRLSMSIHRVPHDSALDANFSLNLLRLQHLFIHGKQPPLQPLGDQ